MDIGEVLKGLLGGAFCLITLIIITYLIATCIITIETTETKMKALKSK